MLTENLQIYKDTKELCRQLLIYQPNIPKMVRYGEYGKAVSLAFEAMDMVYVANSDASERLWSLVRYLQMMGGVRSRIALFTELRYLSPRQSVCLSLMIEKVMKQATGWRNASQRQSREAASVTRESSPGKG